MTRLFVHPGFLLRTDVNVTIDVKNNKRAYGSYNKYRSNLEKLHAKTDGDAVFFVETEGNALKSYHGNFQPKKGNIVLRLSTRP